MASPARTLAFVLTLSTSPFSAAQENLPPLDLDAPPVPPHWLTSDLESSLAPDAATRTALAELAELDTLADGLASPAQSSSHPTLEESLDHAEHALQLAHFQILLATALEAERQALAIQSELAAAETIATSQPDAAPDPALALPLHRELARATTRAHLFRHAAAQYRARLLAPAP